MILADATAYDAGRITGQLVAALVLAILGLAEYANARERYTQGRAQAIWALVLCGVFGCFAVAGVLRGAMRSAASSRQPAAGTRLEFQDVNFRFTAPGRPWAQAEAKKLSPYAKLAFLRGSPEMYFMVTADPCLDADCATERLA